MYLIKIIIILTLFYDRLTLYFLHNSQYPGIPRQEISYEKRTWIIFSYFYRNDKIMRIQCNVICCFSNVQLAYDIEIHTCLTLISSCNCNCGDHLVEYLKTSFFMSRESLPRNVSFTIAQSSKGDTCSLKTKSILIIYAVIQSFIIVSLKLQYKEL